MVFTDSNIILYPHMVVFTHYLYFSTICLPICCQYEPTSVLQGIKKGPDFYLNRNQNLSLMRQTSTAVPTVNIFIYLNSICLLLCIFYTRLFHFHFDTFLLSVFTIVLQLMTRFVRLGYKYLSTKTYANTSLSKMS